MTPPIAPAYVAGRFRQTSKTQALHAPYDGAWFISASFCGPAELEEAVAAAAASFEQTRRMASYERAGVLRQVGAALQARAREFADTMVQESGKPIGDAEAEVARAVHTFEIAAAEAERLYGETIPMDLRPNAAGRLGLTRRFPVGPVLAITPFNFPLNLAVHKIAPAIAAGCPIVVKPAEQTPLSCLKLAELIDATAWPKGALSVVPCDRSVAAGLVGDERFRVLTFTGSQKVGWELKARAGKARVVLELGGNAAVIVDASADLDLAIPRLVYGAFSYAGQKCISVQRLYVHAKVWDEFVRRFVDAARAVKLGDPRDREALVGPMIDERNARRIEEWIDEAVKGGAKVLLGGPRRDRLVPPTVLTQVPRSARLAAEEAFGPTVNLERIEGFAEGIRAVNDSKFGLQCGVFTRDLGNALAAFEQISVGAVIVNDAPSFRIDHMPYGGVKESGLGREGVRYALRDYTEERLLVVDPPPVA
jgi:glyceraldehyde-3-phosphate dehydrogenase (NADP+)